MSVGVHCLACKAELLDDDGRRIGEFVALHAHCYGLFPRQRDDAPRPERVAAAE